MAIRDRGSTFSSHLITSIMVKAVRMLLRGLTSVACSREPEEPYRKQRKRTAPEEISNFQVRPDGYVENVPL